MKASRFMKWNNYINYKKITKVVCFKCYNHKIVEIRGEITYLEERLLIQKPRDHTSM